jgi:hypothetical protein
MAMEDEFRIPLERRIATLRGLHCGLQGQLSELHHELNSVDRRIEAAEELYRREFGEEPPGTTATAHRRRSTRIKRSESGQPPWREAVLEVLRREGRPLHAKEIWQRLQESGFQTTAVDPLRSVVAIAVRSQDQIRRVRPNTFALNGADQEGRPPRVEDRPAPMATEEGDEG